MDSEHRMIKGDMHKRIRSFLLSPVKDKAHFAERFHLLEGAVIIGIIGGLFAILFRKSIEFFQWFFFSVLHPLFGGSNKALIFIPAIGGLIVGPLIYRYAREAQGYGVPEVINAVHNEGGRMRPIVGLVKMVASAITIGSGGSAGREGPIAQIGGVVGSITGMKMFKHKRDIRICVMCGVAAGIGGTFNAPLGGAIFALEVVGGDFERFQAIPVLLASVLGNVVTGIFYGFSPAFSSPAYFFGQPLEIPLFILMGIVFGILAWLWQTSFFVAEGIFDRIPLSRQILPGIGGLLTGILGMQLLHFDILGSGYGTITAALGGSFAIKLLIILGLAKMLATSFTLGSGGSGGVFAPTLYIGTMMGTAFGLFTNSIIPNAFAQPTALGLVGMGALFAGAFRAPITALILIPEMTSNYHLLIPMAITSGVSFFIGSHLLPDSFYRTKLAKRGITIPPYQDPLEDYYVSQVMIRSLKTVRPDTDLPTVLNMMLKTKHPGYAVTDREGTYLGFVSVYDFEKIGTPHRKQGNIRSIIQEHYPTVGPGDTVHHAVNIMVYHGVGRLPVVQSVGGKKKVVGMMTKADVVRAYKAAVG